MGTNVRNADISGDPGVAAAQRTMDGAEQVWVDLGIEAGLLVASSSPVGGQIADGISLSSNLASGNYGGALVDAIGFIPFGGDAFKGLVRGSSIARRMRRANDALAAARTGLSRAQEFARRRMAASQYWGAIKRRRDSIINRYSNCRRRECADRRDAELEAESRLPSRDRGDWVDRNGNRVPAGTGMFRPKETLPDGRPNPLYNALREHKDPDSQDFGIPYSDGKPDLSGFPPLGRNNRDRNGQIYQVEIEQNMDTSLSKADRRTADRNASWGQWRRDYPNRRDPEDGVWHHDTDGVTMQFVDEDLHRALSHEGSASMNVDPGF